MTRSKNLPEQIFSKNIVLNKNQKQVEELQKSLERLKCFKCIQNSDKYGNTMNAINKLVITYLESREDEEGDVLFSKLEEVNQIIQEIICNALEEKRLHWQDKEKPSKLAWKLNRKKVLKDINTNFEGKFCIGESTVWNKSNGVFSTKSAPMSVLQKRMGDIDFILENWNEFYTREKKIWEGAGVYKEWRGDISLGKKVLDFRIRVRDKLS